MSATAALPAAGQGQEALDDYIERAPTPIYVWERRDGVIRLVGLNRAARELTGAPAAEAIGRTAEELCTSRPESVGDMHRCIDEHLDVTFEVRDGRFASGAVRDIVATLRWLPGERVLLHVTDVSDKRAAEVRLRASEDRYRTLIQAANEGVWLTDEKGESIFANQRVSRLLGVPVDTVLAARITDFVADADRTRVAAAIENPRDVSQAFVATFVHRDGHPLTCLVSVAPVGSPDTPPATLCVLTDMSALKREQDLRLESERRYQRIVETASEGVWTVDPTGVTTFVNQRMADLLGLTREEIEGHPFADFAGDPTVVTAVQRAMALDGSPIRAELSLTRKDASRLDVVVSLSALRGERGELLGGMALVSDITAVKRGVEELRESERRFAEVFAEAPVGIAFIGAGHLQRGKFLEINAEFRRLLGYSDEELAQLDHTVVTHPEDRAREQELLRELFDGTRATFEIDKRYVSGVGATVWAHVRVALLRDGGGRPLYLIAVAADITARMDAEARAEVARRTAGTLLEHTTDAVIQMAHDGTVTEFSPAAVRLFGYQREEAIGREVAELIVPASLRARHREALARYFDSGATRVIGERYTTTAMRADGSEFPADVTIDVVEGSDPPVFIGSVRSLVGEHAMVEARQEADERFERAFRDSTGGMALVGLDEKFVDVNAALCELSGRRPGELIGRTWRDIFDSSETAAAVAWQGRALAGATEPLRSRQRLKRSDGRSVGVMLVASLVRRNGQVPVHYVHQYTPHTLLELTGDRKGTGEALTYRERQVLTLLAKGFDGPAVAGELGLSAETVRSYTQSARVKLGAATRTQAVALALAKGEISL
jgi:PAS domain S-box-containing protein